MPGMHGLEICRVVKADPNLRRIPIFVVSAQDNPAKKEESMRLGAAAYIKKPVFPREIVRSVKRHFALSDSNPDSDSFQGAASDV